MAIAIKSLADGQLATTTTVPLYECPASTTAIIKSIVIVNTDVFPRFINVYMTAFGSPGRRIGPKNMTLDAGFMATFAEDYPITMEAGDKIDGTADNGSVVDYSIFGIERT